MKIRVLTPADDVVAITEMLHRAYEPLAKKGLNYTATYQSAEVTANRLSKGHPIVAECDGRVVGTLTVYPPNPESSVAVYRQPHTYSIGQFGVDPDFKRKGIGRALHRAALEHAMSQGASFLSLDTAAPAEELIATYLRWGYAIVERTTWSGKSYESVLMRRNINEQIMSITRRLNLGEGQLYRAVRLEALRDSPEAFSTRYEDAVARSDQSWADQADSTATGSDRATFLIIQDRPVGMAALYRDVNDPEVGELIQMWVAPEVRGGSSAHDLLLEIFRWAGSRRFLRVRAEVMRDNARALRFYEKFGFAVSAEDSIQSDSSIILTKAVELGEVNCSVDL